MSATALKATQQPDQRDSAQPCTPKSRYSCTPAGASTGIIIDLKKWSVWWGRVDDLAA